MHTLAGAAVSLVRATLSRSQSADSIAVLPILSHVDKSKSKLCLTNDMTQMLPLWPMTALHEGSLLYEQWDRGFSLDF